MRKPLIIFFLLIVLPVFATEQTLTYTILFGTEVIGNMTVKKFQQSAVRTEYLVESHIKIDKIVSMEIDYRINAVFENGKLVHSTVLQSSNNKIHTNTKTEWDGNYYRVIGLDGKRTLRERLIDYNLTTLYYFEPVGKKIIWSDSFGKFLSIKLCGNHRYELILPDGKKNFYTYNYGICSSVESEQFFSKLTFRLK